MGRLKKNIIKFKINTTLKNLHSKLSKAFNNKEIMKKILKLEDERKLHLKKADTFYKRKTEAKKVRKKVEIESICIDFAKNLPVPNISTNDAYYCRQLSIYTFIFYLLTMQYSTLIQKQKVKKEARMCVL